MRYCEESDSAEVRILKWSRRIGSCWFWFGAVDGCNYGIINIKRKVYRAHILAYISYRSPVPEGLELDHLCNNRFCVNPYHLEAVTHKVNVLRGNSFSALNILKTRCPKGHEYSEENTYWSTRKTNKGRTCKTCTIAGTKRRRNIGKSPELEEIPDA